MQELYLELVGGPLVITGEAQDAGLRSSSPMPPSQIKDFRINGNWSPDNAAKDDSRLNPYTPGYTNTKLTVTITKWLDSASPSLFQAFCHNFRVDSYYEKFTTATIRCRVELGDGTLADYLTIVLSDVYVLEFSWNENSGDEDPPEEEIVLRFGKIKMTYLRQQREGTLNTADRSNAKGWNFITNVPM